MSKLQALKQQVLAANLELVKQGLVIYTWGNVSGIDREQGLVVIKPSGVDYQDMSIESMVVLNLNGEVVEGKLNPSSDTPTHLALYQAYPQVQSVVHTHSEWATSWAQSGRDIPAYGTTHADYFYGSIPCTRPLRQEEVVQEYEKNTGKVIIETFNQRLLEPLEVPGVIIANHGPFTFGTSPQQAVHNAKVLEEVAKMAFRCEMLRPDLLPIADYLLDKHYLRKHGENAYYGQGK